MQNRKLQQKKRLRERPSPRDTCRLQRHTWGGLGAISDLSGVSPALRLEVERAYLGHTALRLLPCSNACSRLQLGHVPGAHHVEQPLLGGSLEHLKKPTLLSFLPKGSSRLHFQSLLLCSQLQQSGVISSEQLRKLRPKQARDLAERQRTKLSDACPLGPCEWSESWPGEGKGYGQP